MKIKIKRRGIRFRTTYKLSRMMLSGLRSHSRETHVINEGSTMIQQTIARELDDVTFSPYKLYLDTMDQEFNHTYSYSIKKSITTNVITEIEKMLYELNYEISTRKSNTDYDEDSEQINHVFIVNSEKLLITINKTKYSACFIRVLLQDDQHPILAKIKEIVANLELVSTDTQLNIICASAQGFYLETFNMPVQTEQKFTFEDCYNDDFHEVQKVIFDKLSIPNNKGIVLFHGEVGSGKTSCLRHLINTIRNKKIIYMPPDLAPRISSPDFITFLMENPNSIIIIEDAETVLKKRDANGSPAVSNLLNVSDGILGDALHLQIVCTFNCPKDEIDDALLRPGRLIAEYRFDRLDADKTKNLVHKLYGDDVEPKEYKMTLAEIFNMQEELHKSKEASKHKMGFT